MQKLIIEPELIAKVVDLYERMERSYDIVARELEFSCVNCPDNCCDSYFLHHTYSEWFYLWQGLEALPDNERQRLIVRAVDYVATSKEIVAQGERPALMCPVNQAGKCMLYAHRLMICRMHGVPAELTMPSGQKIKSAGCFRCQELTKGQHHVPVVNRTKFYRELAGLEKMLLISAKTAMPRIKLTISQMIIQRPPGV